MIAAIGVGVASQLYQNLFSQKAGATGTEGTQAAQHPPAGPPSRVEAGTDNPGSSVSSAAAKVVADLKTMLLGLQSDTGGTTGTTASASTAAASNGTKDAAGSDPSSQLARDLASLPGSARKTGHGHRPGSPPPDASATAQSQQPSLLALSKGLSAYAASLGSTAVGGTTSLSS